MRKEANETKQNYPKRQLIFKMASTMSSFSPSEVSKKNFLEINVNELETKRVFAMTKWCPDAGLAFRSDGEY